jgi:hypothetical protein
MNLVLFFFALGAYSHSWLHCTNYVGDLETFEPENCLGNPRPLAGGNNVNDNSFGQDIGMNFQPGASRCQGTVSNGLAANYPNGIQTFETGKTYTLAWPPKNHVAADCTNPFIPDAFLKLYMAPHNGATDPDQDTFRQMQVPASFSDDPHVSGVVDYKGFQNCPRFCENTDKSLCTGTFSIPEGTPEGTYTFQWYWAFNSEADLYSTCYEAAVVAGTGDTGTGTGEGDSPQTTLAETTSTTLPPNCGDTCCVPGSTVAPGTGQMVDYGAILDLEAEYLDCPRGYSGIFKMMCINTVAQHVDGWCVLDASASNATEEELDAKNEAILGLSLALVGIMLAFAAYVAITREWITWDTFVNEDSGKAQQNRPPVYAVKKDPPVQNKHRALSVLTESQTELPVVPAPPSQAQWYYVDEGGSNVGPVTETSLLKWARKVGVARAKQAYVWNGTTVADWTYMKDVPSLLKQI